jgi:hypothetical protein
MLKSSLISFLAIGTLLAACSPQIGYGDYATQIFPEPLAPTATSAQNDTGLSAPPETPTASPRVQADAYPVPATAGRPEPYPGETVYPTIDPTQAEAQQQTGVAAATATTAALLQTLTAEAALRPTSWSVATSTPPAVPTRLVINSKPDCMAGDQYTHCHDAVLAIDFDYPATWGVISARLFTGGDSGYGYEYQFSVGQPGLQAGGRSADFAEGREGTLTDFAGFGPGPHTVQATCKNYGAMICHEVQPNAIWMMQFPVAEYVCDPGPGVVFSPTGIVAINLPSRPNITGFLFTTSILSAELQGKLDTILGLSPKGVYTRCNDAAARQQFDAKVKEIVDAIQAGTLDSGTQAYIDQLMYLAQSIRFD